MAQNSTPRNASAARARAAEDVRKTADSTAEAARETAAEVSEKTRSFVGKVADRAAFVAVRTAQEANKVRRAARPYVKPVVYTGLTVIDPPMGLAVIAASEGTSRAVRRARELAAEEESNH